MSKHRRLYRRVCASDADEFGRLAANMGYQLPMDTDWKRNRDRLRKLADTMSVRDLLIAIAMMLAEREP